MFWVLMVLHGYIFDVKRADHLQPLPGYNFRVVLMVEASATAAPVGPEPLAHQTLVTNLQFFAVLQVGMLTAAFNHKVRHILKMETGAGSFGAVESAILMEVVGVIRMSAEAGAVLLHELALLPPWANPSGQVLLLFCCAYL